MAFLYLDNEWKHYRERRRLTKGEAEGNVGAILPN
jgi:hypothetical protein